MDDGATAASFTSPAPRQTDVQTKRRLVNEETLKQGKPIFQQS